MAPKKSTNDTPQIRYKLIFLQKVDSEIRHGQRLFKIANERKKYTI